MVALCTQAFDAVLGDRPHQIVNTRDDVHVTAEQLLDVGATPGAVTEAGLRNNVSVGVRDLEAWLRGTGAVGINNLMEDAATAEIARSQVWQWLHNHVRLDTGRPVTQDLVERLLNEELAVVAGEDGRWEDARALFVKVALADEFVEFLTVPAYEWMP